MTDKEFYSELIKRKYDLNLVPSSFRSYELCLESLHSRDNFYYVPQEHRTYEMCVKYLYNDGSFYDVPKDVQNQMLTKLGGI